MLGFGSSRIHSGYVKLIFLFNHLVSLLSVAPLPQILEPYSVERAKQFNCRVTTQSLFVG